MSTESSQVYSVARGTAYLTTQQGVIYLTYFIFYVIVARILTREEIGQVGLLTAALAFFNALTLLALPATATRFISRNIGSLQPQAAGAVARTTLRLTLSIAIPSTLATILLASFFSKFLFGSQDFTLLLAATAISGLLFDLILLFGGYFLGAGEFSSQVYQNILYFVLSRSSGLLLAIVGLGVLGIVLGWIAGGTATLILSLYLWGGKLPHGKNYPVKPLLVFTLPLFISSLITLAQQWGDITILQVRLGQLSTVGGYYLAVTGVGFLSVLWTPISNALLPALSASAGANASRRISESVNLAIRLTRLTVLPISASLAAIAPTALSVVYGSGYTSDALPLSILALSCVFVAESAILAATLQAIGKTGKLLQITALATALDLATVVSLATDLGPVAGAIGRALLYLTVVYLARKSLKAEITMASHEGIMEGLGLALGVGLPLFATDQLLIQLSLLPLLRLPVLLAVFTTGYLILSRRLQVFRPGDFTILKDALPHRFHPFLRKVELLVMGSAER